MSLQTGFKVLIAIALGAITVSCSDETTNSAPVVDENTADCDLYPCVQDDPENGATHKIGNVYLRIPGYFLYQPIESIKTIPDTSGLGLSRCWPDLYTEKGTCVPVISFHMRAGRLGEGWPERNRMQYEHVRSTREGPFEVDGTRIEEYRLSGHEWSNQYVFIQENDETRYVIARCAYPSCRVFGNNGRGIQFQYRFQEKDIAEWPQIHQGLMEMLNSFIVEERD